MASSREIKLGAVISYISIAINILSGLIYTPWMVDQIGKSQYGLYTLANSLITLFLVDFGLSSATARYLAKYNAEGDTKKAEGFLGLIYKLYLVLDVIILVALIIVYFCLDSIYTNLTPVELEQFKVVYIIAALFSVINFPFVTFNGILTAYEKFVPLKLIDIAYRIFNIVLTVSALLLGGKLYALVTVHACVGIMTLVVKYITIRKAIPSIKVDFSAWDINLCREIFGFSIWVTVTILAQRLVFSITPSILGIVANTTAIAIFGVISTIEGYTYIVTSAINGMFLPKVSRIIAQDEDRKKLSDLLISVGRFQYALNGLIIACFAVIGRSFVCLWMGSEYAVSYYGILLVLIPGLFFNSLQVSNTIIIVENKVKIESVIAIVVGVANLLLSFPLSKRYGVIGASASIFIAYMLRAVLMNAVSYKVLRLDIPKLCRECYARLTLPILGSVSVGLLMNEVLLLQDSWGIMFFQLMVVSAVYLVILIFAGLNSYEKAHLVNVIKKRKERI